MSNIAEMYLMYWSSLTRPSSSRAAPTDHVRACRKHACTTGALSSSVPFSSAFSMWVSCITCQSSTYWNCIKILFHFYVDSSDRLGGAVATRTERCTCDQQVVGFKSYSGQKLRNNLGQVVHAYVSLSSSSITWYRPRGGDDPRLGR